MHELRHQDSFPVPRPAFLCVDVTVGRAFPEVMDVGRSTSEVTSAKLPMKRELPSPPVPAQARGLMPIGSKDQLWLRVPP